MTESIVEYILQSGEAYWLAALTFFRIGAMVALMPAFGEQTIPNRIKLVISISFTAIVFFAIQSQFQSLSNLSDFSLLNCANEVLIGLLFGLLLRFFVFSLQIAGSIAAQSTSLSQIFGGSAGVDPQPAIGHVFVVSGLALATIMNLHVLFAEYILNTYELLPLGSKIGADAVFSVGIEQVGKTFSLGFTLAAPFIIASLVYNVALGVINKAMPQLMVSFVGAPAITAGGLLLFSLAAPVGLSLWFASFSDFILGVGGASP